MRNRTEDSNLIKRFSLFHAKMCVGEKYVMEASILKRFLMLMPILKDNSVSKCHVDFMEKKCAKEFSTFPNLFITIGFSFFQHLLSLQKCLA